MERVRDVERNDENMEENKIAKMKELVSSLSQAARAYYQESREIISNFEYDKLYDQLAALEQETGVVLAGSPTQKVVVLLSRCAVVSLPSGRQSDSDWGVLQSPGPADR